MLVDHARQNPELRRFYTVPEQNPVFCLIVVVVMQRVAPGCQVIPRAPPELFGLGVITETPGLINRSSHGSASDYPYVPGKQWWSVRCGVIRQTFDPLFINPPASAIASTS